MSTEQKSFKGPNNTTMNMSLPVEQNAAQTIGIAQSLSATGCTSKTSCH